MTLATADFLDVVYFDLSENLGRKELDDQLDRIDPKPLEVVREQWGVSPDAQAGQDAALAWAMGQGGLRR